MLPNIGPIELIVILIIALIVIGPGRLPDVGAALGKSIKEFRKASSDLTDAAHVDTSPLPPAAAAAAAQPPATPAPNTLSSESAPNTIASTPVAPPASADPSAVTTPASPSASPAPTPEPSQPVPTSTTVPAPMQAPPVDDDASRPPA